MLAAFYLTLRQHALAEKAKDAPKPSPVTPKKKPRRRKGKK